MIDRSERRDGYHVWRDRSTEIDLVFVGRGPAAPRRDVLRRAARNGLDLAWAEQRHTADVLAAKPGCAGRGDALVTRRQGLAVGVAVADCVPVVLGGPGRVAAVHAGWRGIVAGIIPAALRELRGESGDLTAWIGPAIGPCCYEVGSDVAQEVAAASAPEVAVPGPGRRPHLELRRAVEIQLRATGVERIRHLPLCTRCDEERLFSFRRDGKGAGRNYAFAWLRAKER